MKKMIRPVETTETKVMNPNVTKIKDANLVLEEKTLHLTITMRDVTISQSMKQ